jgi:hypothetical protein
VTKQTEVVLGEAFAALLPHLDERQRRLALGAAARVLGYGGVRRVARVARVAESTVARGARELGGEPADRVRAVGAGASGCASAIRAWSRPCWRWSSRISVGTRSPRCAGR